MLVVLSLLLGCVPTPASEIQAGNYLFSTVAAEDQCLDGAMEALFMPEGPATPNAFEFPVYLPARTDTPLSYEVSFRAPSLGMPVTVIRGDTGLAIDGSVMDAIILDAERYGNCTVTMTVDANFQPGEAGIVNGTAQIAVSNPRGSDNRCPPFQADPCIVDLTLRAVFDGTTDSP